MRNGVKAAVVGGVCVTLLSGAGYGVYNFASAMSGDSGTAAGVAPPRTGPPSGPEVKETTKAFFAAWEKGTRPPRPPTPTTRRPPRHC